MIDYLGRRITKMVVLFLLCRDTKADGVGIVYYKQFMGY